MRNIEMYWSIVTSVLLPLFKNLLRVSKPIRCFPCTCIPYYLLTTNTGFTSRVAPVLGLQLDISQKVFF